MFCSLWERKNVLHSFTYVRRVTQIRGATKYDSAAADMVNCSDEFRVFLVVLLSWYKVLGQNCKPKDCIDLKCYRVSTATNGEYIYPDSTSFPKLKVTCDQTSDGGGWIIYVHRFDGSVPSTSHGPSAKTGLENRAKIRNSG